MTTTKNAAALLPCPFCGSNSIDPKGWASANSAGPACDDCGASAGNVSNNLADNIAAWNRRATLAQPDAATNNAAALERLEQKWREEAAAEWAHCQNKEISEWVRDRCYGQHNRLLSCADELATLRATLAQPDALTSQPSGVAVAWLVDYPKFPGMRLWSDEASAKEYSAHCGIPAQPLFTHPSADAPGVAVDEAMPSVSDSMVHRFRHAYENMPICATEDDHVRAALTAALAPKPEGGHG